MCKCSDNSYNNVPLSQLFGRAGRGGTSRAHLFFSTRQKKVDPIVKRFCFEKENCRRKNLLEAIGSSESVHRGNLCCDVCAEDGLPSKLQFDAIQATQISRKRRVAAHVVSEDLKSHLKAHLVKERDMYLQVHPNFQMLGLSFICPDCVIDHICQQACFVMCEEDTDVVGLRPELRSRFYDVIENLLSKAPVAKRTRRTLC